MILRPLVYLNPDGSSSRASSRANSISSYPDDIVVETVRSEQSTPRGGASPRMMTMRTPPPSPRRDFFGRAAQSVSLPQSRVSTPRHPTTARHERKLISLPSKSLQAPSSARDRETEVPGETFRTTQEIRDTLNQWKSNNSVPSFVDLSHRSQDPDREFEHHLQTQKEEYETIIQRHLHFIDQVTASPSHLHDSSLSQLIEDKKKLSGRCDQLVSQLKSIDKKSNDRIHASEEFHRLELQRLKDTYEAAEKLRRERWIEEKTKKIKEITVRGLEPEIQKLINRHKGELAKVNNVHQAELLTADERAAQRYIRLTEELREQLEREKQEAIARERELAREKYEKAIRDEQQSFVEQRRRLFTEVEDEKNRQADLVNKQRIDLDR